MINNERDLAGDMPMLGAWPEIAFTFEEKFNLVVS